MNKKYKVKLGEQIFISNTCIKTTIKLEVLFYYLVSIDYSSDMYKSIRLYPYFVNVILVCTYMLYLQMIYYNVIKL